MSLFVTKKTGIMGHKEDHAMYWKYDILNAKRFPAVG
jgi:hypothetical protein